MVLQQSSESKLAVRFAVINAAVTAVGLWGLWAVAARGAPLRDEVLPYCVTLVLVSAGLGAGLGRWLGQLQALANIDPLTGLFNRRFIASCLDADLSQERRRASTSMLFIDLDRFKELNDGLGHGAGDDALRAVAASIRSCLRSTDIAARVGGDEFSVILSHTPAQQALAVAQRIVATLEGHGVPGRPSLSVSIGIAEVAPGSSARPDELLAAADHAMFAAKRAGGRQIVVGTLALAQPELVE